MSSSESVVEDWDAATKLWEHMLIKRLQPDRETPPTKNGLNESAADGEGDVAMEDVENQEKPLAENPLLMTEAPWNTGKAREKAIEIAMENWGCPAFWMTRTQCARLRGRQSFGASHRCWWRKYERHGHTRRHAPQAIDSEVPSRRPMAITTNTDNVG